MRLSENVGIQPVQFPKDYNSSVFDRNHPEYDNFTPMHFSSPQVVGAELPVNDVVESDSLVEEPEDSDSSDASAEYSSASEEIEDDVEDPEIVMRIAAAMERHNNSSVLRNCEMEVESRESEMQYRRSSRIAAKNRRSEIESPAFEIGERVIVEFNTGEKSTNYQYAGKIVKIKEKGYRVLFDDRDPVNCKKYWHPLAHYMYKESSGRSRKC
jgi:hypothetical protein